MSSYAFPSYYIISLNPSVDSQAREALQCFNASTTSGKIPPYWSTDPIPTNVFTTFDPTSVYVSTSTFPRDESGHIPIIVIVGVICGGLALLVVCCIVLLLIVLLKRKMAKKEKV